MSHPLPFVPGVLLKEIPGHPGYAAGTDGSIWSSRVVGRRGGIDGPWRRLRTTLRKDGRVHYHVVTLWGTRAKNRGVTLYVHRLVLETFFGPCPNEMVACHGDGNPDNNNIGNLRWGTRLDNEADKRRYAS